MADLVVAPRPAHDVPRAILILAAVLVAIVIAGAWTARISGVGRAAAPEAEALQSLALRFADQDDGAVIVRRAGDDATIYRVAPETNGFLRATLRGLAQQRRREGDGDETPFVLTRWADGRMSLDDPKTGRRVALEAFGETNAGAFAKLFLASGAVR
jgi:putative photosynthetic complex assembly protein